MFAIFCVVLLLAPAAPSAPAPSLAWNDEEKDCTPPAGATSAVVRFHLKNVSSGEVTIERVVTSCGCTVAKIPREPWVLRPGEEGDITATVDLRGKFGTLEKTVTVQMPGATKILRLAVHLPDATADPIRLANQAAAKRDRQAVFAGACAACHADPLRGQTGSALYQAACEICHQLQHRASMVPSLVGLPHTDAAFWRRWITSGQPGTLMPAFSREQGGPLTSAQIDSLIRILQPADPRLKRSK